MNELSTMIGEALSRASKDQSVDLYCLSSEKTGISAFKGEVSAFSRSTTGGASARALCGKRLGTAYSEKLDGASIDEMIKTATRNAAFLDDDDGNGLNETATRDGYDAGTDAHWLDIGAASAFVIDLERRCKEADKRIVNVPSSDYESVRSERVVGTSGGLLRSARECWVIAGSYLMASDGTDTETGYYYQLVRDFAKIDPELIVRKAVENAVSKLGAKEPSSGNCPVVLFRDAASSLLGAFLGNADAESMQKGMSKLAGKIGQKIGNKNFTVIDDPAAPGFGKTRFDDEGVDSLALDIFRDGYFVNPIHSIYSARREGKVSNGRGFRASIKSRASAALINAFLPDGSGAVDSLVRNAGSGILIGDITGGAGIDPVSGDFSCPAQGFEIVRGSKGGALRNFTISGNFYELVGMIAERAADRRIDSFGEFSCPSLLIEKMSISGK